MQSFRSGGQKALIDQSLIDQRKIKDEQKHPGLVTLWCCQEPTRAKTEEESGVIMDVGERIKDESVKDKAVIVAAKTVSWVGENLVRVTGMRLEARGGRNSEGKG